MATPRAGRGVGGACQTWDVTETAPLPTTAGETTPQSPWPLRVLASKLKTHIDRAPETWVEGEVVQYKRRGPSQMSFFTLRDTDVNVSASASTFASVLDDAGEGFDEGARVVVRVKPTYFERSGSLTLQAKDIRLQGVGSLLAQIERLRQRLAAEGIFAAERKQPLPPFPRVIGLVCGKDAKAKDDVLVNARLRWPTAQFELREVLVQGTQSAQQVSAAITELDALPQVDVIVVARGGGSVEDLLPFSDESVVRAAAAVTTPLVSAIGHEGDAPLLDLVADYRASTPTDAARRIVPDVREELGEIGNRTTALRAAVLRVVSQEQELLGSIASRHALQRPDTVINRELAELEQGTLRVDGAVRGKVSREMAEATQLAGMLKALSPESTLERGYSIIRLPDGTLVRDASQLKSGDLTEAMLARGTFVGKVVGANPAGSFITPTGGE